MSHARRLTPMLACGLLLVAGCDRAPAPLAAAEEDARLAAEAVPTVPVVTPERTALRRTVTQPATIHAWHRADIHAQAAGYLRELRADIGDTVKAGEVMAVIALPEAEVHRAMQEKQIERVEADERKAAAEIALAAANIRAAGALLTQARAQVRQTEAQLVADRAEFDRTQDLVSRNAVAARVLDESRGRFDAAGASKAAAEAAVVSAEANVAVAEAKRAAAEAGAAIAAAETAVARKRLDEFDALLAFGTLTAPFDGTVTDRNVDPGDLVRNAQASSGAAAMPLFSVARLDKVRVRIPLPENDAPYADVGDEIELRLRSSPQPIAATVSRVSGRLDESTRTMTVEADLPNPDGRLRPGMYGEATVVLEQAADALVLPATAVRFTEKGQAYVYVVGNGEVIRKADVTTGFDDGRRIAITAGLESTDRVVAATIGRLQDGQKVRVAE